MIEQGLEITGIGMAYIFGGLIAVLLLALVLTYLFKGVPKKEEVTEEAEKPSEEAEKEGEIVAAIAAALVNIERGAAASQPGAPRREGSPWAVWGRQAQMASRSLVKRQR